MENICFYLVQLVFVHCFMASLAMTTNVTTDQSALLEFKAHINFDPHNVLAYNWSTTTSVCNWVGVSCGARHGRVTALNLPNMDFRGTIPPHLGNLSFLVSLNLSGNNFYGHLPKELRQLHHLKLIDFNYNNLSGRIPSWFEILSKLQNLGLLSNNFTGTIPQNIFNMKNLETLDLSYNFIQGKIPNEIGMLPKLTIFRVGHNQLSGSIPSAIYNISSLQEIDISFNSLSGSLPDDMCNRLQKLELLYLSANEFVGQLPSSLGACTELQNLSLSINQFTGRIPRNIGNLTKLKGLYFGNTYLRGEIPWEVGNLHNLETLSAGGLGLVGVIPHFIFNMSSLKWIYLLNNSLSGSLPIDMCHRLPALQELDIYNNLLTGIIPKDIANCTLLKILEIGRNQLTGEIPDDIGNLNNLEKLHFAGNHLTGFIPSTIFNISTIKFIFLERNHLLGRLPLTLGLSIPNLEVLDLFGNNFSGIIPSSISNSSKLTDLELSWNSFSGLIPNTLGNLRFLEWLNVHYNYLTTESYTQELSILSSLTNCKHLRHLDLSHNPLNGNLPTSMGNLSASLEQFYVSGCQIKGSIPMEVGNLSNMIIFSLSYNELTGSIPATFGRLRELQGLFLRVNKLQGVIPYDLCHLERLDRLFLSDNNLSGPIPTCLANSTSLRHLYLNSNKLSSTIPSTFWNLTYILEVLLSSNSLSGSISMDIQNLRVVTTLELSKNLFSGNIPITIEALKDLVSLSLAKNRLQGPIPESLGGLVALESLDLSYNNLSGVIPKSLKALSYLKEFNVSFNKLEGEIPTEGPFKNFSAQSFMWNYGLCGLPRLQVPPFKTSTLRQSDMATAIVLKYILPVISLIILVSAMAIVFIRCCKRNKNLPNQENLLPLAIWRRISYQELQQATNGFDESNFLGKGSFGSVYKGTLSDGMNIAVKVFTLQLEEAFRSFDVECEVMSNIRHRNLVKIISNCCSIDFKALVLQFMPNGNLEKWLYSHNCFLDILQRMNIMIDVASALEYLHHGISTPVVHCDLKPNNVLLDDDMVAHVGDFGIAKLLGEGDSMTQTMTLATIGYMAPEHGSEGIVSLKGDVYSYGILLMETFTRKKPTDEMFAREVNLKCWVNQSLPHAVIEVVDANLLGREEEHFAAKKDCLSSILGLALECSAQLPEQRINMKDVLPTLKKIKNKYLKDVENLRRRNL